MFTIDTSVCRYRSTAGHTGNLWRASAQLNNVFSTILINGLIYFNFFPKSVPTNMFDTIIFLQFQGFLQHYILLILPQLSQSHPHLKVPPQLDQASARLRSHGTAPEGKMDGPWLPRKKPCFSFSWHYLSCVDMMKLDTRKQNKRLFMRHFYVSICYICIISTILPNILSFQYFYHS